MDPVEKRVWQRVMGQSGTQPGGRNLKPLIAAAREQAAAYRQLLQLAPAGEKPKLQLMYDGERAQIACLRGMARLSGEATGNMAALPGVEGPAEKLLKLCYFRSCRALTEYTARWADPEFGAAFRVMAEREQQKGAMLLELLGQWELSYHKK